VFSDLEWYEYFTITKPFSFTVTICAFALDAVSVDDVRKLPSHRVVESIVFLYKTFANVINLTFLKTHDNAILRHPEMKTIHINKTIHSENALKTTLARSGAKIIVFCVLGPNKDRVLG
jgi:hypothetical protein